MTELVIKLVFELTEDMEDMRDRGFRKAGENTRFRDEFNVGSTHLVAEIDGTPIGLLRISPWPISPMQAWLKYATTPDPFTHGPGTVEITASVVSREHRRQGIYSTLLIAGLLYCSQIGVHTINIAIEPKPASLENLHQIGFVDLAAPITFGSSVGVTLAASPLASSVTPVQIAAWRGMLEQRCARLAETGLQVAGLEFLTALAQGQ